MAKSVEYQTKASQVFEFKSHQNNLDFDLSGIVNKYQLVSRVEIIEYAAPCKMLEIIIWNL